MRFDAPNRRTVLGGALAAAAALGVSGCRGSDWYPSELSPDESLLHAVIAEKRRLIAWYTALIDDAQVDDPALYQGFLVNHERHLAVLRERLPERAAATPAAAPPTAPSVPEGGPRGLRMAESAAAANRLRQLGSVTDPALAQLFASIGACESGHAHLLPEV